jgi:hypothetical protein
MAITDEQRLTLTHNVMNLFDDWGLSPQDRHDLLDLPDSIKVRHMGRFADDEAFPDLPQVMKRIEYVVRIADALRTSYPTSPQMRNRWMKQRNHKFNRKTPLGMMLEDGESGLIQVLCHLDCTFAWDRTGSTTAA